MSSEWNNNNKSTLASDHSTSAGSRINNNDSVGWNNYSGTKGSHDTQVNQYNVKDRDGNHTFYSPKSGRMGVAGGNRDNKK